jgi:ubiquinone/menaquinone biosynthesis C-methylase UbiE
MGVVGYLRSAASVSWQHPAVRAVLPVVDMADGLLRSVVGNVHVPPYSHRIRSNGVARQLGGWEFIASGAADVRELRGLGLLFPHSRTLDVGCGVGRMATAIRPVLSTGSYLGLDVDRVSVQSCRENGYLNVAPFRFEHVDMSHEMYNPGGSQSAFAWKLPVEDHSVDLVLAMSVFTHLLSHECQAMARELERVLAPAGAVVVTAFILDDGDPGAQGFPARRGNAFVRTERAPRKAIAYAEETVDQWFSGESELLRGSWHGGGDSIAPRSQDWIIVRAADPSRI